MTDDMTIDDERSTRGEPVLLYNALAGQGAAFGLIKPEQATIERYVTQKALDGLYTMIAEEEKKIRANPLAAGSDIVRRVFGALK